jgi:hypothetical protein
MADCTYADDLNIRTTSISDLARQADKLTAYADWAKLVNMDKSSATAALHCSNADKPYDQTTTTTRIRTLAELKITTNGHIVNVHTGMCMPASQLKTLCSTSKVGYKHKKALNKITILLNMLGPDTLTSGEYYEEVKSISQADLPADRRKVSPYTTSHILAAKPAFLPIKTALERQAQPQTQQTVHIDLLHKRPRKQYDASLTAANIRAAPDLNTSAAACEQLGQKRRNARLSSGWDIFKNIPPPEAHASHGCFDKHTNQRWTLFNLYAAFDGDHIADIVALQQAHRQSGTSVGLLAAQSYSRMDSTTSETTGIPSCKPEAGDRRRDDDRGS